MFVRFVNHELDKDSHRELGVFQAIFDLQDAGLLGDDDEEHLEELRRWFSDNLEKPFGFTDAKPPHYRKRQNGISWFKDSAKEHISKIWDLVSLLEAHEVKLEMTKTARPNFVIYEDQFQIVAVPFADSVR
jgi:hypothetical protein